MSPVATECDIPAEAFDAIVAAVRDDDVVHLDEALVELRVELTAEVLAALKAACDRAGVRLDEDVDQPPTPDEDPAVVDASGVPISEDAATRARRRRALARASRPLPTVSVGSNDSMRMYLREIGQVPLLTAADEQVLGQRIADGEQAKERLADLAAANELDNLDVAERRRLQRLVRDGDLATTEMTQANLRLVVSIAKRYVGRGMQLLDLIQEGNLGLMRAVQKFDHTKGFKFSTYATWWIRQSITRAIADQARTIRIPVHMVETINKVHRIQRQLLVELEREPTIEEVAERADLTPARVREIESLSLDPLSLDATVGDEDDSNLVDFIHDTSSDSPVDSATRMLLNQAVLEALDDLSERERDVMRLRFGLDDGQPRTLEQVGEAFGVTRERIRQIESKTLAKLRRRNQSQQLRDYLDA